ncbi:MULTISPECIES: carboxypeptidase M32 [Aeribacillus]|uniref:carboxypeptidase M32 n=1 Tax=Aeribacillus TaxID=1055323 RepID=UPI0007B4BA7F|nr:MULTISPECIES: carboxypeptidase M32 [Aeribacillus]KZM52650.1 peptidase M32 [Aeribacillus pallidus]MED0649003.1 carboxypeptidase M32 [Aeribacillus composti]MED0703734.1 carboxypeptidase M32 [Aeribacillus composti]MED4486078.1 carboxypeptidase M32 [Aeribacillus pallidus]
MIKMGLKEKEQKFFDYLKKMESYEEALNLMYWDLRTGAPKNGLERRAETIGILSEEWFQMSVSDTMKEFLDELTEKHVYDNLSSVTKKALQECREEYEKNIKIPKEEYKEYVILQSKSESVWEEAKANADFNQFAPYLEKLIEFNKKFISYWGYKGHKYNTLLHLYEPGITVETLDKVFAELKKHIVPLVQQIVESSKKIDVSFLHKPFPKEKQRKFSEYILKEIGYNFDAGRLDETVHPFEIRMNRGDVRITTKYDETDFRTAVFGTIHEAGHAIYEQNINEELEGTPLADGASMGIHESQSLFYENLIGRNYHFWKRYYNQLKTYAPNQFTGVSLNDFYRAINEVKPSLIRIEADELTYCLHIIVRYEIEKLLFEGNLDVSDLPKVWNDKYSEYLGIAPDHDGNGVLQDVHWAGGSFGYFPSYALGYMYATQLMQKMEQDLSNVEELIENGEFQQIQSWLTKHVHLYGKMKKPLEILKDATGESLNPAYFIQYLEKKYKDIYSLD